MSETRITPVAGTTAPLCLRNLIRSVIRAVLIQALRVSQAVAVSRDVTSVGVLCPSKLRGGDVRVFELVANGSIKSIRSEYAQTCSVR